LNFTLKFIIQLTFTLTYPDINHFTFNSILARINLHSKSIFLTTLTKHTLRTKNMRTKNLNLK